jgi:hypothetical protein
MSYSRRQLYALGETFGDSATRKEAGGRIVYGGGGGSSAPAPQATTRVTESGPTVTNRTTANEIPEYLTNASQDLIARGQALTSRPYEAYTGSRVAEFSPDMQTAFGRMRNQGVAGQTTEASGLASLAGRRATDYGEFQTGVQQYMNPYMQGVVDIERRKAQEAADQQAAALSGQAVRQGAFGGSGAALQQRALRRDTAQQLGDIQAQGLNRAYEGAVNQYNAGITGGLSAASQLSGLGQQQFGQEMDITKGLATSGDVQREREQALLDVGYGDYLTAQKYPYEQLAFQQGLVSGVPYSTTQRTSEISQPGKTVSQLVEPPKEQPNPASQLIGAGVAAYGASGKAKGGEIKRYAVGGPVSGIAGLNQPEMASALKGMSDPEVQGTAAVPGLPGLTAQTEQIRRDQLRMAAEGQQAPASMTKITSVLSQMSDAELQQYAKLNKNDPYTMALVVAEANRRKEGGMPTQEQPKVVDQQIASMALPEETGIAQLPVGNMEFAGGGIIAFANGDEVPNPKDPLEIQRAEDRKKIERAYEAGLISAEEFSRAISDIITLPVRGVAGALDTAVVRPLRAFGADIGYLSPYVTPEGASPESMTPFSDQMRSATPVAAKDAGISSLIQPSAARDQKLLQRQDPSSGGVAEALAAQAAAAQGAGPAPAGAGGAGNSGSGLGGYQKIIDLYDQGFEAQKQAEEEAVGIEETAMTKDRTAQEAAIEEAKKYGSDREERLKKREEGMEGEKERNVNTSFIEAGLAIMAGESPNALLNIAKGARLGLQGYEERLSKINASKEKLDEDFSRLYELRQEKVGAAGERLRQIDREIAGLRASAKRNLGNLASSVGDKKIAISTKVLDNAEALKRSTIAAGISSNTPTRQIFEQLKQKYGGDTVKAQLEYNKLFGEKSDLSTLGLKAGLEALYKKKADVVGSSLPPEMVAKQTAAIDAEIAKLTGGGGKITTMAEIRAVAAKRGVPEQQIMDAAKAKGYIIQ